MSSEPERAPQELPRGPGTYVLLLRMYSDEEVTIGRLGKVAFPAGYYLYAGSALGGLRGRVARHLRPTKRLRWHVDYVTTRARIIEVWWRSGAERMECTLATRLAALPGLVPCTAPIGASDCGCDTHLFHGARRPRADELGLARWRPAGITQGAQP